MNNDRGVPSWASSAPPFSPRPAELEASGLLNASLGSGGVMVYVKDRAGRYVRVNDGLTQGLATSAERLLGHRDEDLPPGETIDGPRVHSGTAVNAEQRALAYVVPQFGNRPDLTVLRFAVLDVSGAIAGHCGVAAVITAVGEAEAEAERLMMVAGLLRPATATQPAAVDASDGCDSGEGQVLREQDGEIAALRAELADVRAELMETRAELAIARRDLARRPEWPAPTPATVGAVVARPSDGPRPGAVGPVRSRRAFGRG